MRPIFQHVLARQFEADGRTALLLHDSSPETISAWSCYLRFAFVLHGTEKLIFPAFILDDWGSEIKGTAVYLWIKEFGSQFPRAEVFGLDENGQEKQWFIRELDLVTSWPCYVCQEKNAPIPSQRPVEAILLPANTCQSPARIQSPSHLPAPLRSARVSWWQVPKNLQSWPAPMTK